MENNNLTELKHYLEQEDNDIAKNSNAVQYGYNLNLNLYKEDTSPDKKLLFLWVKASDKNLFIY